MGGKKAGDTGVGQRMGANGKPLKRTQVGAVRNGVAYLTHVHKRDGAGGAVSLPQGKMRRSHQIALADMSSADDPSLKVSQGSFSTQDEPAQWKPRTIEEIRKEPFMEVEAPSGHSRKEILSFLGRMKARRSKSWKNASR